MARIPSTLSIERVRDLRKWRTAAEELSADYYTLELMLALYDHAPALLDTAEAAFELEAEVREIRAEMDDLKRKLPAASDQ